MKSPRSDQQIDLVLSLVERIGPILTGHPPSVQSSVLANLTAILLASYQTTSGSLVIHKLLNAHVALVRELEPIYRRQAMEEDR